MRTDGVINLKGETMSDLISRQAAIDALKEHRVLYCDDTPETFSKLSYVEKSRVDELDTAISTLVNLPSVQLEPHEGHWIEGGIYRDVIECNCSECGQLMTTAATVRMNFCPNCGAKMKEENRMSGNCNDAENYCKDCDRSIYGKYPSCDTNIENNGIYTKPGSPCYCKCREGVGMVEKYPWEKRTNG
jgi:NADH pyrophosphatase NudC (nudix superfamily)